MIPKIHSTPTSRGISGTLLIVYLLYSMFSLGIPVMLVSFALGMIVYSVYDSIELATAITVVIGVVLSFTPLTRRMSKEGFTTGKEGEKNDTPPAAPAAAPEKKVEEKPTAAAATAPAIPTAAGGSTTATAPTDKSGFKDIKASTASSLTSGSEAAPAAAPPAAIATPAGHFKLGEIPK